MLRGAALVSLLVLCLTACGGTSAAHSAPKHKVCPNQQRALVKIGRDIAALRAAAKLPTKNHLIGNHAINVATDRFLYDVAVAPITNLKRNRMIDHAAGTLAGACEQCFQALEAARPIPNIRLGVAC